jgi:hypothetical protein
MTARVFVPLVGANGSAEQIFEAIGDDAAPEPHPARLVPQIAELFDFGLYRIGQTVREAVTRFVESRRARVWLGRANARVKPWHLRISDLQVGRLSDENARSAGLGLALAAVLQAFDRNPGLVFATGEIVLPTAPGSAEIAVGPVDGVRGKLTLIGDYIVRHRAALAGQRMVILLPALGVDGNRLAVAEASMLERIGKAAADAGAKLDVVFLETLDGVEAALGPFEIAEFITPKRALWSAAAVGALALVAGGWTALAAAPVRLEWVPVAMHDAGGAMPDVVEALPQRARYDAASDKLQLLPPCYDAQRQPVVVGGETLLLRVKASDGLPWASRIRTPRIFIASVSRAADPVIVDESLFRRVGAVTGGGAVDAVTAIPIEPIEDEVRVFVVATRDPDVQISSLVEDLRRRLQGLSGAAVLTTTASFLKDRIGNEIDYQFKVTSDARLCSS